jgi:hypothetical protein
MVSRTQSSDGTTAYTRSFEGIQSSNPAQNCTYQGKAAPRPPSILAPPSRPHLPVWRLDLIPYVLILNRTLTLGWTRVTKVPQLSKVPLASHSCNCHGAQIDASPHSVNWARNRTMAWPLLPTVALNAPRLTDNPIPSLTMSLAARYAQTHQETSGEEFRVPNRAGTS